MSKFVSVAAGLLTVGGIIGFLGSDSRSTKQINLYLGLISSGITAGSTASLLLDSASLKKHTQALSNKFRKEIDTLNSQQEELVKHNQQFKFTHDQLTSENNQLKQQVAQKELEVTGFKRLNAELEQSTRIKLQELEAKLNLEDERYDNFLEEVKDQFAQSLKNKINYEYERIADTTAFRVQDERFEDIKDTLGRFYLFIHREYKRHHQEILEMYELEGETVLKDIVDIYYRISMEVASYHIRLRNLLNTTEKLTIELFRDELIEKRDPAKFVPRAKSDMGLDHFETLANNAVANIEAIASENEENLKQIEGEVGDLMHKLEAKAREIKKLQAPMSWRLPSSQELKIGNLIINYFWKDGYGIILDRSHFESDGYNLNLYYQLDRNPRAIVEKELNEHSESLQQYCRTIRPISFSYDGGKGLMVAKVTLRERPKVESNKKEDIYKAGLIPAQLFGDTIFKALNHKSGGKPTLRVMAATGEGKGIVLKNLLAYFLQLSGWEIWLSDPLDGSEQDFWDAPKIAKNAREAQQAHQLFCKLHHQRHELKQDGFTSNKVLGLFDEFDKQHQDDDKEAAKNIMTAIRHSQLLQILVGQGAEVGNNGWTWDDMQNCALLALGNSIGTLTKHLTKDFGWSVKRKNKVVRDWEKYLAWVESQNTEDIPNENHTRLGLLLVGGRYEFLELPIAHKGILRNGNSVFRENLEEVSINAQDIVFANNNSTSVTEISEPVIHCPHCNSTNIVRNGKHSKTKEQLYSCKDCNTSPVKWTASN